MITLLNFVFKKDENFLSLPCMKKTPKQKLQYHLPLKAKQCYQINVSCPPTLLKRNISIRVLPSCLLTKKGGLKENQKSTNVLPMRTSVDQGFSENCPWTTDHVCAKVFGNTTDVCPMTTSQIFLNDPSRICKGYTRHTCILWWFLQSASVQVRKSSRKHSCLIL